MGLPGTPGMKNAPLRSPDIVMSPQRAGAVVPTALSFSRAAMRVLVRGRWQIEKLRFDLDSEGRGEVLYRLKGDGWVFHFFLVSTKLPEEQKTDRNFAQGWDAMGVLCQGEWTPAREAHLRREVPKQRAGYADYDTLIYARGNRSARLFDHVVESLAAGRQPDPALIAPVGYILRTTAFIGNGQLGTRPFAGYEPDHPLRRPYHAQFCSAFLLREYVFDLVDHMARARNPHAQRLSPEFRRYLGLGNAAATGLVAFVVNHPHFMHRWTASCETALSEARHRSAKPHDLAVARFKQLLERAIRHFRESERAADGVFTPPQSLAEDLLRLRGPLKEFQRHGTMDGTATDQPWCALCAWAKRHVGPEALETLHAIVLELYADIVERAEDDFEVDERFEVKPEMSVAALREALHGQYGWALAAERAKPPHYFWYRSRKAPRDVRRGLRSREQRFAFETAMDTVEQVRRLWTCLQAEVPTGCTGEFLSRHPELRHIVARVQSVGTMGYAELRDDWLCEDFSPFAPIRYALSFFGMEKFEAAQPKSVRGTFMQGAPIAEDVEQGRDGEWPFPLMPNTSDVGVSALRPLPASRSSAANVVAPSDGPDALLRIAPRELARMVQTALQGHGVELGVAEDASLLVMAAHAEGRKAASMLLAQLAAGQIGPAGRLQVLEPTEHTALLDAQCASALLAAPSAMDLACAQARTNAHGIGAVLVSGAVGASLVRELCVRCAERGLLSLMLWRDAADEEAGFSIAGFDRAGPWVISGTTDRISQATQAAEDAVAWMRGLAEGPIGTKLGTPPAPREPGFLLVCRRVDVPFTGSVVSDVAASCGAARAVNCAQVRRTREEWMRHGLVLTRREFAALNEAGATLLVPESEEPRILSDGADPLKAF